MLRKLLAAALIILGLASAGLGLASGTIWRDSDSVVATATPAEGTIVVTDPGVLGLVNSNVTVRAFREDGGEIAIAVGRDVDVTAWIGNDPYTRVTGLDDWQTLTAVGTPASGQGAPGADPTGSELWIQFSTAEGEDTLRWDDRPGRWSLMAAGIGDDAEAPTLELTWRREVTTPWFVPGIIFGSILLLLGLGLLPSALRSGSTGRRSRDLDEDAIDADEATYGPLEGDQYLTDDDALDDEFEEAPRSLPTFAPVSAVAGSVAGGGEDSHVADELGDLHAVEAIESEPLWPAISAPELLPESSPEPESSEAAMPGEPADEQASAQRWAWRSSRRSHEEHTNPVEQVEPAAEQASDPQFTPAVEPEPVPLARPEEAPAAEATEAPARRRLPTRREIREMEQARAAAENPGLADRLRNAFTGATPIVVPEPRPDEPEESEEARSTRSEAWRVAWGFDSDEPGGEK